MTETDIDLIRGLAEQSPKAQKLTLQRYGNDVFAQVARLLPSTEDAEEVYQDVFVKVFRNIAMYDAEKSSLRTWISRIAYNESVTWLRHKRQAVIYFEDREGGAEMPVVNKRFSFSVQLDKRKVGRIRTVMPDGSLCKLWTNLDFVPGETYRITTHNGYYDEDRDYEKRVGRNSGKSLLNDLQRRGIDDQTVEVTDEVPEEFRKVETARNQRWPQTLPQSQQAQLKLKAGLVQMDMENIKSQYKTIGEIMSGFRSRDRIMLIFDQILQKNKDLDKKYQEVIKLAKKFNCPAEEMPNLYKAILEFYTEQNKALNDAYNDSITHGKTTRKLHEYVTKQTEKYIKEMEKSLHLQ